MVGNQGLEFENPTGAAASRQVTTTMFQLPAWCVWWSERLVLTALVLVVLVVLGRANECGMPRWARELLVVHISPLLVGLWFLMCGNGCG